MIYISSYQDNIFGIYFIDYLKSGYNNNFTLIGYYIIIRSYLFIRFFKIA